MDKRYGSPPMQGFLRTSVTTAGSLRHLGVPYGDVPEDYTALDLDFDNFEYEGTLSNMKRWAFNESDILCTGGITVPDEDGNFFKGDGCPTEGRMVPGEASPLVSGGIPLVGDGGFDLGEQVMDYQFAEDSIDMINVLLASDMQNYFDNSEYAKLENGDSVPEIIARMGIFIHMIHDRNSHYYCTDDP